MQLKHAIQKLMLTGGVLLTARSVFALPQYAVKHRITRCTACHVSPTGGSVRNLDGKYYGARFDSPPEVSRQDYVYADARALFFAAERDDTADGAGIMAGVFAANLPLDHRGKSRRRGETRFVFAHSFGSFATEREAYLSFRLHDETENHWLQYAQVGRLQPAFGWRTDNHRVYTRIVSQTTWNDFVMGAQFSGDPAESLHYDLMTYNGESSRSPGQLAPDKATKWGGMINGRWLPASDKWPLLLGASALHVERLTDEAARAWSVYLTASLHRRTRGRIPLHFTAEVVEAKGLNHNNADLPLFVADTTYLQSLAQTRARAFLVAVDWEWQRRWSATYQYDEMILDTKYRGDYYRRHGLGARHDFGANMYAMARYEWGEATPPSERARPKQGGQDAFWFMARVSF